MPDVEETLDEDEIVTEDQPDKGQEEVKEGDDFDWKADALKHRAISTRLKVKLAKTSPIIKPNVEHDDDLVKDVQSLKQTESKRQYGYENSLSPEETDLAFKFANGKPTKETLEDSFFKAGLEGIRAKKRLESNLPGSSSRSSVFNEKSFADMDEGERKKAFENRGKALRK